MWRKRSNVEGKREGKGEGRKEQGGHSSNGLKLAAGL